MGIPQSAVHNVVYKRLQLRSYKIPIVYKLQANDKSIQNTFALDMLWISDNAFLNHVVFSDEAAFHVSDKANRHNCQIWGSENPHLLGNMNTIVAK